MLCVCTKAAAAINVPLGLAFKATVGSNNSIRQLLAPVTERKNSSFFHEVRVHVASRKKLPQTPDFVRARIIKY
jgi:hypothetical protein